MPLPPAPPAGYDWMPFSQRLLRATPLHPALTVFLALVVADVLFTIVLVVTQPLGGDSPWTGFVHAIEAGFWFDYLVMLLLAYVLGASDMMRRHLESSLDRLRPFLDLDDAAFQRTRREILAYSRGSRNLVGVLTVVLVISLGGGLAPLAKFEINSPSTYLLAGLIYARVSMLLWTSATLMHDELLAMWRLTQVLEDDLKVDVYGSADTAPLGQIGVVATFFMAIGVSLSTPLLVDADWAFATTAYLILLIVGSVLLLVLPAVGARQAISRAKTRELARLTRVITDHPGSEGTDAKAVAELGAIVDLRDRVDALAEWPFGRSTVLRWMLIVSIPVGSWFAGALVERFVDSVLG